MNKFVTGLIVLALVWIQPIGAKEAHWTDNPTSIWQDGDTIHVMAKGRSVENARLAAEDILAAALAKQLPDLDPIVAKHAAAVGDKVKRDDWIWVRLDFPAGLGNACRTSDAWWKSADTAAANNRPQAAIEDFAHAAWLVPSDPEVLDSLAHQLAEVGLWASASVVLDAGARLPGELPPSLLRNRATVHIWMRNPMPAMDAIDQLREYDPADPQLPTLEAMARVLGGETALKCTEKEVMPVHAEWLNAELTARFVAWFLMDEAARDTLIDTDLGPGYPLENVDLGPARFERLIGKAEETGFWVEDRGEQRWELEVSAIPDGRSLLELSGELVPPGELDSDNIPVLIGAPYPLEVLPGIEGLDGSWLRPIYYSTHGHVPERINVVLFLQTKDGRVRVDIDGPLGEQMVGRPGLFVVPQLVDMLVRWGGLSTGGTP